MKNPEQFQPEEPNIPEKDTASEETHKEPRKTLPENVDKSASQKNDERELRKVRASLEEKEEKHSGWKAERKPRDEWYEKKEIFSADPIETVKRWAYSFSKTEREKRKTNEETHKELKAERARHPETVFDYKKGAGVEGRVVGEKGILAKGFGECSGLVLQTKDAVSIIHISPNIFKGTQNGGEMVKDYDVDGHISSALKGMLDKTTGTRVTEGGVELNPQEKETLQKMIDSGELKATMLSGEEGFVPHEIALILGEEAKFHNLPFIKTDIHYVGNRVGEGYAIYANPKSIYCIGANNIVMKNGKNFPPTMYEFKEKTR